MADFVDAATRSRWMAGIKASHTQPERFIRRYLHCAGFRFRLHPNNLPGRPDIVLPRWGVCIFVHGCFWHHHPGCRYGRLPSSRSDFWREKFRRNSESDSEAIERLTKDRWRVIIIWECGIKDVKEPDMSWLPEKIRQADWNLLVWPELPPKPSLC